MHAWEAIQKTLNHIEEHIGAEIEIEDLAAIASLSLFYTNPRLKCFHGARDFFVLQGGGTQE